MKYLNYIISLSDVGCNKDADIEIAPEYYLLNTVSGPYLVKDDDHWAHGNSIDQLKASAADQFKNIGENPSAESTGWADLEKISIETYGDIVSSDMPVAASESGDYVVHRIFFYHANGSLASWQPDCPIILLRQGSDRVLAAFKSIEHATKVVQTLEAKSNIENSAKLHDQNKM
ncbi:hypothetical protein [Stenotrophomonas sp.]|uniref:hypothetical protein n=1 Tax=Stenotrophomonas sp. TaxID=69392 RepID=UPI0029AFE48C|nr:hypothetical protein [Stenotrophomonas sp.]MDX3934343.1 hypothetical protein [Stenotrophomonas sp.]